MDRQFPPEIWRNIFRFATFTATTLNVMDWDPHWPYAPGSLEDADSDPALPYRSTLSTPTKKALTLVSRHFRTMSLEFLFELVELFHTRNGELLLDTILSHTTGKGTGHTPAKWFKYIIVNLDHGRPDSDVYLIHEVFMSLFSFCTNLSAFGWKSFEWGPSGEKINQSTTALMASIPLTITRLEWLRRLPARSPHVLRNHTALRNLRVSDDLFMFEEDWDHDITMPLVTHLDSRTEHTDMVVSRWNLSSLAHLNLDLSRRKFLNGPLSKCKDTIRSIYIVDARRCGSDDFPRILASMPRLDTFSYGICVNMYDPPHFSTLWLGVVRHASLTHLYLFCRGAMKPGERSFSKVQDFFSVHLQPLANAHMMPLTVSIVDTMLIFREADYRGDEYDDGAKQRFFDDLSAILSSANVQCIVK